MKDSTTLLGEVPEVLDIKSLKAKVVDEGGELVVNELISTARQGLLLAFKPSEFGRKRSEEQFVRRLPLEDKFSRPLIVRPFESKE